MSIEMTDETRRNVSNSTQSLSRSITSFNVRMFRSRSTSDVGAASIFGRKKTFGLF